MESGKGERYLRSEGRSRNSGGSIELEWLGTRTNLCGLSLRTFISVLAERTIYQRSNFPLPESSSGSTIELGWSRPNLALFFLGEVLCPQVFVVAVEAHSGKMGVSIIVLRLSALRIRYIFYLVGM